MVYPVADEQTLRDLVAEYKAQGGAYRQKVQEVMRSSYRNHYRMVSFSSSSRACIYTLPFGYAAWAMRAVSLGTGQKDCGCSDIQHLLKEKALFQYFLLS